MSPKSCSLAVDEIELEKEYDEDIYCDPVLTVLVGRQGENSIAEDCIKISGRINVSF